MPRFAPVPVLCVLLAAAVPARAQGAKAPAAVAEVDRLRAARKLREASAKAAEALAALGEGGDAALRERLLVAEDAVRVAAAAAYARGEDCGLFTAEERAAAPLSGEPLDALSRRLTTTTLERLLKVEAAESRDLYLKDAAFAPLREVSAARFLFFQDWKRRHLEVWPFPTLRVDTSDPRFDAVFDFAAHQAMLRPGEPWLGKDWLREPEAPSLWQNVHQCWQRALLFPADYPLPRLRGRDIMDQAVAELGERAGPGPWGFDAMVLLPLVIETGDLPRARFLVEQLRRCGGIVRDVGLNSSLRLFKRLEPLDEAQTALRDLVRAHALGTPPATVEEDAGLATLRAGIEEQRRLTAAGKLAEARARGRANRELAGDGHPLDTARAAAEVATNAAAGYAYARDVDAGWFDEEELARAGLTKKPLRARGHLLLLETLMSLSQGVPLAEMRHTIMDDPLHAPLRDTPILRCELYVWGQPASVLWPKLDMKTGDPTFDRVFRENAMLSPQPGMKMGAIGNWMDAQERKGMPPVEVWLFRWRCALVLPYGEGGWPTRLGLLQDPVAVGAVLKTLEERVKKPKGFDAMVRVNLHLAAGDFAAATAAVGALHKEGGIFYDMAVDKALNFVLALKRDDPERRGLAACYEQLVQHAIGLPPGKRR